MNNVGLHSDSSGEDTKPKIKWKLKSPKEKPVEISRQQVNEIHEMLFGPPDKNELPKAERQYKDKPTHPSVMGHDIMDERLNR